METCICASLTVSTHLTHIDCFYVVFQMCVSKCPDRFATYTDMQLQNALGSSYWNYYRQFCKPGFNNPNKVAVFIV